MPGQTRASQRFPAPSGELDKLPCSRDVRGGHQRIKPLALAEVRVGNPKDARRRAALHVQDTPGHAYLIEAK
jgi:hypothetical protein